MSTDQQQVINSLDDLFKDSPSELSQRVLVPSRCLFYNIEDSDGKLTVNPITFADEKAMVHAAESAGAEDNAIDILLRRCVPEVSPEDMFEMDKIALIIKLRSISYGNEYVVTHKCPACNNVNDLTYNLDGLEIRSFPDDFEMPIKVNLPNLNKEAEVRMVRGSDSQYTRTPSLAMENVRRFVVSLGGKKDPVFISAALNDPRFPLKDMKEIVKAIGGAGYGIDTTAVYECEKCRSNNITSLPLDVNFFSTN